MKIRYFFGFALLYLVCVGAYAFYITADYYTLDNTLLVPFTLTLPLALWVCLPAALLLFVALFFMSCVALARKLKQMSLQRDFDKIFAQIHEQMLGNPVRDRVFSRNEMKTLSQILKRFELLSNTSTQAAHYEKIDSVFESFKEIEEGKYNAKIKLNPSHPLYSLNMRNSIQEDSQKGLDILKQDLSGATFGARFYTDYARLANQKAYDMAWSAVLKNPKTTQKALALPQNHLTFATIMQLLQACVKGSLDVQKDKILEACKSVALSEREYLMLAIESCKSLNQENINVLLAILIFKQRCGGKRICILLYSA